MLLGRCGDVGEMGLSSPFVGAAAGVRPRSSSRGVVRGARSGLGAGAAGRVAARMGESGGGGMEVPSVREARGARTGSSNLKVLVLGAEVGAIVVGEVR